MKSHLTKVFSANKCRLMKSASTFNKNKAGYTATLFACGWAGAVLEKVTRASGQEPYAQKAQKRKKKKVKRGPTDRLTDRQTDIAGFRVAMHATLKTSERKKE